MFSFLRHSKTSPIALVLFFALFSLAGISAQDVTGSVDLAWDSNPESDIAGYRVKYGLTSGSLYGSQDTGAPVTEATIHGLVPGQTYYFAVLAYNTSGIEGPLSEEISHVFPVIAEPYISVEKSSMALVDGLDSGTLGTVVPGFTGTAETFIIRNVGDGDLTGLTITIDGTESSDFIVSPLTTTVLAPGADTTFSISFKPTGTGTRNAVVHISSDDSDLSPFDIPIHGVGLPLAMISVADSLTGELTAGISTMNFGNVLAGKTGSPAIITIFNSGEVPLTDIIVTSDGPHASDFLWETPGTNFLAPGESTKFQVIFKPTATGDRDAVIHIASSAGNPDSFDITLSGSGVAVPQRGHFHVIGGPLTPGLDPVAVPRLAVFPVVGDPLTADADSVAFGNVDIGSTSPLESLIIRNLGTAPLTDIAIVTDGSFSADFSVSPLQTTTLAPGESTTIQLSFKPSAAGTRSAGFHLTSNDSETGPFSVRLTGSGVAIAAISLENARGLPITAGVAETPFADVPLGSAGFPVTYTIRNIGNINLTGIRVFTSGPDARSFLTSLPAANSLAPGASTTFTVVFKPVSAGKKTAGLQVTNSLSEGGPLENILSGIGTLVPEIKIVCGKTVLRCGNSAALNFRTLNLKSETQIETFTIRNSGSAKLTDFWITKDGPHAMDFTVINPINKSIAPGESTTFSVSFSPSAAGSRRASIAIHSNAAGLPIVLAFQGKGESAAEINVGMGKTNLVDDNAFIEFGAGQVGKSGRSKTITISNVGSAKLKKISVKEGGIAPDDFSVSKVTSASLNSGKSTTFKVTFTPHQQGIRWAALRVTSNDKDEESFDIVLTGTGSNQPVTIKKKKKKKLRNKAKSAAPTTPAQAAIPVHGVEVIDGRKYRTLTIKRGTGQEVLPEGIEVSSDLVDWASGSRHTTVLRDDAQMLKIRDNTPVTRDSKRYIRLSQ